MKSIIKPLVLLIVLTSVLSCCKQKNTHNTLPHDENAVYYWRTWFNTNDFEKRFLENNEIQTMYIRFFDVETNPVWGAQDKCRPVGTIVFPPNESFRKYRIVPVIFITPEAIKEYASFTDHIAHRIHAMCVKNAINIDEVQFDCDWTASTRNNYFQFLVAVRRTLKYYFGNDIAISSTIRLHQLAQTPPEVDYGVLMCYNTGNFKKFETRNSILDINDMKPYTKYLDNYPLPLKLALPCYSWCVEFKADKSFARLNRLQDPSDGFDTASMKSLGGGLYEITADVHKDAVKYVRHEEVSAETIIETKSLIEKIYGKMPVVLYHLDSVQLVKYGEDEIKAFFN